MFAQCLQAFDEHSWAADDFLRANMSLLLRVMLVRVFTTLRGLFTSTLVAAGAAGAVKDATLPMPSHWTDTQSSFRSPNAPNCLYSHKDQLCYLAAGGQKVRICQYTSRAL